MVSHFVGGQRSWNLTFAFPKCNRVDRFIFHNLFLPGPPRPAIIIIIIIIIIIAIIITITISIIINITIAVTIIIIIIINIINIIIPYRI